jgi:hypothetical protein
MLDVRDRQPYQRGVRGRHRPRVFARQAEESRNGVIPEREDRLLVLSGRTGDWNVSQRHPYAVRGIVLRSKGTTFESAITCVCCWHTVS